MIIHVCICGAARNIYIMLHVLAQYNSKDSSVKLVYEAQPRPRAIASLAGETIVKVACGTNHTGDCDSVIDFIFFDKQILIIRPGILLFHINFVLYMQWRWIRMALSTRE